MTKNLVIVESPTKAKVLRQFLGKEYCVLSSNGHIRDLPAKKAELTPSQLKLPYSDIGIDLENGFTPIYVSSPAKKKIIKKLKSEVDDSTVFYLASDEDREGEAISWHLLDILDPKRKHETKRVVFHEITKGAILDAFKKPRDLNMHLVEAQQSRRFLDRIVGYKLSPLLWKKIRFGLSAGRVQSSCVRLVVDREREIQAFVPEEYWSITALLSKKGKTQEFEAKMQKKGGEKYIPKDEKHANDVLKQIKGNDFTVSSIEKKEVKRRPSPAFITSTLQQEASRKLGFSAKKTMMIAQKLYEGIEIKKGNMTGLITYMRTDSINLSQKALDDSKAQLQKMYGKQYTLDKPRVFSSKSKGAQEAHEAIRPTEVSRTPESLKSALDVDQYKLYELIWKRTLATQAPDAVFDAVKVGIKAGDYDFTANGQTIKFPGFIKVYVEGVDNPEDALNDKDVILPELNEGEVLDKKDIIPKQHFTKGPSRYSEASLIKRMEEEGIGRPSTYAPTISTIQSRGYITLEQKQLIPTDTAYVVTDMLVEHFNEIVDLKFTSGMEDELDKIAEGSLEWKPWLKQFWDNFKDNLAKKDKEIKKQDLTNLGETDEVCDMCGKKMMIKLSKYGKFLSCTGYPECKNAKPIMTEQQQKQEEALAELYKNEKCPLCGKGMNLKNGKYGHYLSCSAYPDCKGVSKVETKTGVKCPRCEKGEMVEKKTGRGKLFWGCNSFPSCDFASWDKPIAPADEGQKGFYIEKKGDKIFVEFDEEEYLAKKKKYTKKR